MNADNARRHPLASSCDTRDGHDRSGVGKERTAPRRVRTGLREELVKRRTPYPSVADPLDLQQGLRPLADERGTLQVQAAHLQLVFTLAAMESRLELGRTQTEGRRFAEMVEDRRQMGPILRVGASPMMPTGVNSRMSPVGTSVMSTAMTGGDPQNPRTGTDPATGRLRRRRQGPCDEDGDKAQKQEARQVEPRYQATPTGTGGLPSGRAVPYGGDSPGCMIAEHGFPPGGCGPRGGTRAEQVSRGADSMIVHRTDLDGQGTPPIPAKEEDLLY